MNTEYKNIEDLLDVGTYKLKVLPANEYDNVSKKFIPNTHISGEKNGYKWWKYNVESFDDKPLRYELKGKDIRVSVFANEKTKQFFDSGEIECTIKNKELDGQEILVKNADGDIVNKKIAFFDKVGAQEEYEELRKSNEKKLSDDINPDDIPF